MRRRPRSIATSPVETSPRDASYRPVPVYARYQPALLDGVESSRRRVEMPQARGEERAKDFRQVELGFTRVEGQAEAARCLRCHSEVCVGCTFCARTCPDFCIRVERVDDPGRPLRDALRPRPVEVLLLRPVRRAVPDGRARHTGQYELSFYSRDLTLFDKDEMVRSGDGSRATGATSSRGDATGPACAINGAGHRGQRASPTRRTYPWHREEVAP